MQDRGEDYSVGKDSSTHSALFDLELSTRGARPSIEERVALATAAGTSAQHTTVTPELHAKLKRVAYLASPVAKFEVELLQDVQALREDCSRADGEVDLMRMAQELCRLGYACSLQCNDPAAFSDSFSTSTNKTTSGTTSTGAGGMTSTSSGTAVVDSTCLEKLHHSFIICTGRSDRTVAHYCLVDPHFRDQFRIGQPTESYDIVLSVMPPEFVGSPLRLQALADLLCTEIVEVYKEQKLPLPPWRKSGAMLSKWFDVSAPAKPPPPLPPILITPPAPAPINTTNAAAVASTSSGNANVNDIDSLNANNLVRARSGGWSDLATIQETPSPHHTIGPVSVLAGSSSDLYGGSVSGHSVGGSSDGGGRQKSGKVVSLLARGLSGLGLNKKSQSSQQQQAPSSQGGGGAGRPPHRSLSAAALEQRRYQEQQQQRN